jgi:hypothetical protein
MQEHREKFSTREWIFLITILLLIQFLIHWLSLNYGGSTSALGYVSFAGTVISILLGLIAIIYSFVQSISQTSSAVEIREQIEKLISAGEKITNSKNEIHKSAQELGEITKNLSGRINENTDATNKISNILFEASQASNIEPDPNTKSQESAYSLFSTDKIWATIALVAIGETIKRKWTVKEAKEMIINPVASELGMSVELAAGMMLGIIFCLESEGYIKLGADDNDLPIADAGVFKDRLDSIIPDTLGSANKQFEVLWRIINNLEK